MIEESYLLTLSEPEIRNYLRTFVKSCEDILRDTLGVQSDVRLTKVKIALLKSYLIINRSPEPLKTGGSTGGDQKTQKELLVSHIVQIKRSIVRLFESIHPGLTDTILEEQQRRLDSHSRQSIKHAARRTALVEIGYFALLLLTLGVLWVVLFR
ncbi:MAG: hypothetical protein J7M24_01985 [Candidatus Latescibacteria bacterium]|nr:hypothetical protein [Candidatus Latescibacterota bacterium]